MQAITTRYYGPTNHRQSRIIARAKQGQSFTMNYKHGVNLEGNHMHAARDLAHQLGWTGLWHIGGLANGDFVFVIENRSFELVS